MSTKIQLALQGGGAKIVYLLAVLEAIEELEESGEIQITQIAGTSAGALAGSLFASGLKVSMIADKLRSDLGNQLIACFPAPTLWNWFQFLVFGTPFWNTNKLENTLIDVFNQKTIRDLKKSPDFPIIKIVAADLGQGLKKVYSGDDAVVSALLASTGIPCCLKTWSHNGDVIVDGGICENLPVSELLEDRDTYGNVVAVTFPSIATGSPRSLLSFFKSLAEVIINNPVIDAKGKLNPRLIYTITPSEIGVPEISTFSFCDAIRLLKGHEYSKVKNHAKTWFSNLIRELKQGENPLLESSPLARKLMTDLYKVFKANIESKKKIEKAIVEVTGRSLLNGTQKNLDEIRFKLRFCAIEKPVGGLELRVPERFKIASWELRNVKTNDIIKLESSPAIDPNGKDDLLTVLLFPEFPLPTDGTEFELSKVDQIFALGPLLEHGRDEIAYTPVASTDEIREILLVFHYPENSDYELRSKASNPPSDTSKELHSSEFASHQLQTPAGFKTKAWIAQNVKAGRFGVDVDLKR